MSLDFSQRAQSWSAVFYAKPRIGADGKAFRPKVRVPLGIPIEGIRPKSLDMRGDEAFERSRAKAMAKHDEVQASLRDPVMVMSAADRAVEIATNRRPASGSIHDLERMWQSKFPEGPNPETAANNAVYFAHFVAYVTNAYPGVEDLRLIDHTIVSGWAQRLVADGYRGNTFKKYLSGLSSAFKCAMNAGIIKTNPIAMIPRPKVKNVAHRKPWTPEELDRIINAAKSYPVFGPAIITAALTPLRRADCCMLEWIHVDLRENFMLVPAHKTSVRLQIPIFPRLREVLEQQPRNGKYVFPEAAAFFTATKDNRNALLGHLVKVLSLAGFDYYARSVFETDTPRLRKASLAGWHAFKTTYVTIALDRGVPEMLLRKVCGNQVVDVVLENYYQPGRASIAATLVASMPIEMTGAPQSEETPQALLERMTESNWRELRTRVLQLLG